MSALLDAVRFNADGLVCAIAQDARTGAVLMQAWMNAEALERTRCSGLATFWSRSRQSLWVKGETSGNRLHVEALRLDCDGDCLLLQVRPEGPACHTGARDCFFQSPAESGWQDAAPLAPEALARLRQTVAERRQADPGESYVAKLLARGNEKVLQKLGEEAVETVLAGAAGDRERIISESADLLFHLFVAWEAHNVGLDDVQGELARRAGMSGLAEKAARGRD
mgnify:CR=1 FL=1